MVRAWGSFLESVQDGDGRSKDKIGGANGGNAPATRSSSLNTSMVEDQRLTPTHVVNVRPGATGVVEVARVPISRGAEGSHTSWLLLQG